MRGLKIGAHVSLLLALLLPVALAPAAQNQEHTVVERRVSFRPGRTSATVSGTARYAMSYVYKLRAREGQKMNVRLTSPARRATFSVIAPDESTIEGAFGATRWTGELPQNGEYRIVVVMNDDAARSVPYKLSVGVR